MVDVFQLSKKCVTVLLREHGASASAVCYFERPGPPQLRERRSSVILLGLHAHTFARHGRSWVFIQLSHALT